MQCFLSIAKKIYLKSKKYAYKCAFDTAVYKLKYVYLSACDKADKRSGPDWLYLKLAHDPEWSPMEKVTSSGPLGRINHKISGRGAGRSNGNTVSNRSIREYLSYGFPMSTQHLKPARKLLKYFLDMLHISAEHRLSPKMQIYV